MYLEKITERYFVYCQFCIHENHCELHHHEFRGIILLDLKGICIGRILYNPNRKILVCEDCGTVIERLPENEACGKFFADLIFPTGKLPPFRPNYEMVLNRLKKRGKGCR